MEFTVNGAGYRVAKLSVFDQLRVARKLLPVLAPVVAELRSAQGAAGMEAALPKIAVAISELSDDSVNAILFPCLAVVSRNHLKAWVPVFNDGLLAFDDIDLFTMLQLVARVVADSLGNFLHALPTSETAAVPSAD
ncbi:hypothetical protein TUM12370_18030 [Salmonella enterica subsp. enterica serovar Choleraesuis]|nr:hypothetical protein TUM12370_18030 [Salmonella enterica subsp. enterica serovar Choleraesuis]